MVWWGALDKDEGAGLEFGVPLGDAETISLPKASERRITD